MCELEDLDERVTILRVRIDSLDERRLFQGRDDEYEYLIEGTVEGVDFSNDAAEDDDG